MWFYLYQSTYFLFAKKESRHRKSSPVAGVNSEFYCFLPCPVLIRPPGSTNPGSASLPRAKFYLFQKNIKTHTPAHEGSLLAYRTENDSEKSLP
jgi:hypothetical protein